MEKLCSAPLSRAASLHLAHVFSLFLHHSSSVFFAALQELPLSDRVLLLLSRCLKHSRAASHPERLIGKQGDVKENGRGCQEELAKWIWEHFSLIFLDSGGTSSIFFRFSLLLDLLKADKQGGNLHRDFLAMKETLFRFLMTCVNLATKDTPSLLKLFDLLSFLMKVDQNVLCYQQEKVTEENEAPSCKCLVYECADLALSVHFHLSSSPTSFAHFLGLSSSHVLKSKIELSSFVDEEGLKPSLRSSMIAVFADLAKRLLRSLVAEISFAEVTRVASLIKSVIGFFSEILSALQDRQITFIQSLINCNDKDMIQILIYIEEILLYSDYLHEKYISGDIDRKRSAVESVSHEIELLVRKLFSHSNSLDTLSLFLCLLESMAFDHSFFVDILISPETCGLEYFLRVLNRVKRNPDQFKLACDTPPLILSSTNESEECLEAHSVGKYLEGKNTHQVRTVIWLESESSRIVSNSFDEEASFPTLVPKSSSFGLKRVADREWLTTSLHESSYDSRVQSEGKDNFDRRGDIDDAESTSDDVTGSSDILQRKKFMKRVHVINFLQVFREELLSMRKNGSISFECGSLLKKLAEAENAISQCILNRN